MTLVTMSSKELGRLGVIRDVDAGRITASAAATALGLTARQVYRLLKVYRQDGPSGLASRRRGRASNHHYPKSLRKHAMWLIREYYTDFGPTLAAEKLSEVHDVHLSRETLRQWMMDDGLWMDRNQRLRAVHQPRDRRECFGELVHVDGSEHWWSEDRGPQCTLLVYIDDATGQLKHLRFVASESAPRGQEPASRLIGDGRPDGSFCVARGALNAGNLCKGKTPPKQGLNFLA